MHNENKKALSEYRIEKAYECLKSAILLREMQEIIHHLRTGHIILFFML